MFYINHVLWEFSSTFLLRELAAYFAPNLQWKLPVGRRFFLFLHFIFTIIFIIIITTELAHRTKAENILEYIFQINLQPVS